MEWFRIPMVKPCFNEAGAIMPRSGMMAEAWYFILAGLQ